jgi:hypothetical protein
MDRHKDKSTAIRHPRSARDTAAAAGGARWSQRHVRCRRAHAPAAPCSHAHAVDALSYLHLARGRTRTPSCP